MNFRIAAALVIAASVLAAWRVTRPAAGAGRSAPLDVLTRAPIDARGAALAQAVARLSGPREPENPPDHARDLFRFAEHVRSAQPAPVKPAAISRPAESAVIAPRPALRLIGVAEDAAPGGPVRTAIISGPGQVYVAREGDPVASRYRVARISPDVVELIDAAGADTLRLALK